jgi:hypothetical protein
LNGTLLSFAPIIEQDNPSARNARARSG